MQRLDSAEDLYEALAGVAGGSLASAWIRGRGTLRDVRLSVPGPSGPVVVLDDDGVVTLVSMDVSVHDGVVDRVSAVVVSLASGVASVHAGYVDRAMVVDIEVDVSGSAPANTDAPASVSPSRAAAQADDPWQAVAAASASQVPASSGSNSAAGTSKSASNASLEPDPWAAVAAASDSLGTGPVDEVDPDELRRNDVLLHPSLGRCYVVSVINDNAVKVRLANRSVRKLMLTIFVLERTDEPQVYTLTKRDRE
jgi:hypothetical protein